MTGSSDLAALRAQTAKFRTPTIAASAGQLASAFVPLIALYGAMYWLVLHGHSVWWALALAPIAAGLIVRIFIFQHDCGHGSFWKSAAANRWTGLACSVFTLTPYENWRRQHAGHHLHWNDLDNRNSGTDIYSTCLTLTEFKALTRRQRTFYRFVWNPFVALIMLPPVVFLLLYRLPFDTPADWTRERRSVHITNAALIVMFGVLIWVFGWQTVLIAHLPAAVLAAIVGVWMFSLQHRFEDALWAREGAWNARDASLAGSSHLVLPRVLQWVTGNIGYHHIHHLDPRVPNYRLEACHNSDARFDAAPTVSLWQGLSAMRYCLWDETRARLIPMP